MDKTIKIILASLWILIALILTVFLVRGIQGNLPSFSRGFNVKDLWEESGETLLEGDSVGNNVEAVSIGEKFSSLDIELINEKLIVEVWEENYTEIIIDSSFDDSKRPKVYVNGDTVEIKTPKRNNAKLRNFNDSVIVKISKSVAENLFDLDVDIVSGSINISDIQGTKASLSTVSGSIHLDNSNLLKLSADSVSGSLKTNNCKIEEISAESVSGSINFVADVSKSFELGSVSGSIRLETNTMPILGGDCESMSGSIKIFLPENDGFKLDYESISGSVSNEFTSSKLKKSGENVYKNGNIEFDVESVSGSISFSKI